MSGYASGSLSVSRTSLTLHKIQKDFRSAMNTPAGVCGRVKCSLVAESDGD